MSLMVYPVIWDEELHEYRPMRWAEILESRRLLEQSQAKNGTAILSRRARQRRDRRQSWPERDDQ